MAQKVCENHLYAYDTSGHEELGRAAEYCLTRIPEIGKSRAAFRTGSELHRHEVHKVYAHDAEGRELMLLGSIWVKYQDGRLEEMTITARVEFADDAHGKPKIKFFQGWSVKLA